MIISNEILDAPQSTATPYAIPPGASFTGRLGPGDPEDWVAVTLAEGASYEINLQAGTLGDPFLLVYDPSGAFIDSDDDSGGGLNSQLVITPSATGTYYFGASSFDPDTDFGTYTLSVSGSGGAPTSPLPPANTPTPGTLQEMADYLRVGYWVDRGDVAHKFDTAITPEIRIDTSALTAAGRQLAYWALESWAAVTDLTFTEITPSQTAQIIFDDDEPGAFAEYSRFGGLTTLVRVNISTQWITDFGSELGSFGFQTYVHEIGHALGLGHLGNYNFDAIYPEDATFSNDSWLVSVMSYFDQIDNLSSGGDFARLVMPMPADIRAVQQMYGTPDPTTSLTAGDTTYGGPNQSLGTSWLGQIFDRTANFNGGPVAFALYDVGGYDVIDLSDLSAGSTLRLGQGTVSDLGGLAGTLTIVEGSQIEAARGSAYNDALFGADTGTHLSGGGGADQLYGGISNDTLEGGAGNDFLEGGAGDDLLIGGAPDELSNADGADTFIGGAGNDTVSYEGSFSSLRVDLLFPAANTFTAAGDTYDSIENLIGSQGKDNLRGTFGDNRIEGRRNVDYIYGRLGDDTLVGGIGDDVLFGGPGADVLIGGANRDRAQYSDSPAALLLDLVDPSRNNGIAKDDTYDSIEDIAGTEYADTILGDNNANFIAGRGDADLILGRDGNDSLNGGGGFDTLRGGDGDDNLRGGPSRDTFVFDSGADLVEDWFLDTLRFDRDLWGGAALSETEILAFGSEAGGQVFFDFGSGQTLLVVGAFGPVTLAGLSDYIESF